MKHHHEEFDQSYHPHRDHRNDISSPVAVVILLLAAIAIMALLPTLNSWPGRVNQPQQAMPGLNDERYATTNMPDVIYDP